MDTNTSIMLSYILGGIVLIVFTLLGILVKVSENKEKNN